jgi:hypothetical protein
LWNTLVIATVLGQLTASYEPVPMTSAMVSGAVVATWGADSAPNGARLTFLVLVRGTPGWVFRGGSFVSKGSARGQTMQHGPLVVDQEVAIGPVRYTVTLDPRVQTISIGSQAVSLREANVVLVDGIDSQDGPHIVHAMRVDPAMPTLMAVSTIIRGSAELRYFLRCDLQLEDPAQQRVADALCGM